MHALKLALNKSMRGSDNDQGIKKLRPNHLTLTKPEFRLCAGSTTANGGGYLQWWELLLTLIMVPVGSKAERLCQLTFHSAKIIHYKYKGTIFTNFLRMYPFLANVLILCPLKTWENHRFSDVFRGYKMETLARNGLTLI